MKKLVFTLAVLLIAFTVSAQNLATSGAITVTAQGVADVKPDVIQVTVAISGNSYDQNPKLAFDEQCQEVLKKLGVESNAKLQNVGNPNANFNQNAAYGQQNACSFFANNYTVSFSSLEEFEKLKADAESMKKSALQVNCTLSFVKVSQEQFRKYNVGAYEDALKVAKSKAEVAVNTLGGELSKPTNITETPAYNANMSNINYVNEYYQKGTNLTVPLVITVNVSYELK